MSEKSCATCKKLQYFKFSHAYCYYCFENKNCPCNLNEVPDREYSCEYYIEDTESTLCLHSV